MRAKRNKWSCDTLITQLYRDCKMQLATHSRGENHNDKTDGDIIRLKMFSVIILLLLFYWRRQWQPTPVLLPGKPHGQRNLVGCSPWGHKESDTTWATSLSLLTFRHWRRKRQPSPVFLPGEFQGRQSLVGCHLWGHTESDTTEAT